MLMRASGLLLFLALIGGGPAWAEAASAPQTVLIGLDLSKSNPLVNDEAYAARAAARVARELQALPLKSRVMLRTFGSYDGGANTLKIDQVISAQAKPRTVATGVATLIAGVPELVREGRLKAQGRTNIVPFLETMAEGVDCRAADMRVMLITDGFEDSEYTTLTKRGGRLPAPATPLYRDCSEFMMLGIGEGGGSPSATKRLQAAWGEWAERAGFRRFSGLHDW